MNKYTKCIFCAFFVLGLLLTSKFEANAQVDKNGVQFVNVGLAVGSAFSGGTVQSGDNISRSYTIPTIGVTYEVGVHQSIVLGGFFSFGAGGWSEERVQVVRNHSYKSYILGAKGSYYFNSLIGLPEKWDLFAGLGLSFSYTSNKNQLANGEDISRSASWRFPNAGIFVGGRYYFNEKIGVYTEFGLWPQWWTLGATFRIN